MFNLLSVVLMVCVMASIPDPSGAVALIYSPSATARQAFVRALGTGARPLRLGRFDWIIVVMPDPNDTGFVARAHAGGVLAIVNPLLAGGCSTQFSSNSGFYQRNS